VHRRLVPIVAALAAVALAVATTTTAGAAARPTAKVRGDITVSAAASLTGPFTALGAQFEKRNPDKRVTFNFGSSSSLVAQIEAGAPADVFASADLANMDDLVRGGQVTASPTPFARNHMALAVKPGNPERIRSVADLPDAGTIALCGASVPCGVYAAKVLEKADVAIAESKISRGVDAKATLAAVSRGDADAAIVYVTDVRTAGRSVTGIEIPPEQNVIAVYPIAPIADAANPKLAKAFVRFVTSVAGQKQLARYGFLDA
jgi:molybdate transport system substrate-binding protein